VSFEERVPEGRFSDRVADYERARPGYPEAVVDALEGCGALFPGAVVADVGSGTGLSSRPFLARGYEVHAVEPNDAMRAAAERALGAQAGFRSVAGKAEATGLAEASVDLVVAAQAFHWFEAEAAREELRRVLRPAGRVALLWNVRRGGGSPFLSGYEDLLRTWAIDYAQVDHRRIGPAGIAAFFGGPYESFLFENVQRLDRERLRARLFSSSYTPPVGHPHREPMAAALDALFDAHQRRGEVALAYDVELFVGPLAASAGASRGDD